MAQVADGGHLHHGLDRGLAEHVDPDLYVAGDNIAVGREPRRPGYAEQLGGEGQILVLRGIPTVITTSASRASTESSKAPTSRSSTIQYAELEPG